MNEGLKVSGSSLRAADAENVGLPTFETEGSLTGMAQIMAITK
jgi:hypothetical protein